MTPLAGPDANLNVTDVNGFAAAFIACDPAADLNKDQVINTADATLFMASYTCGCNP